MSPDPRAILATIKRFDQLVAYLRDQLDWPISSDDFEELTFDYTPDELGIDPKYAVKIKTIKRIRPLSPVQPWGVFFIEFERKRLPVVVLRRILRALLVSRRRSSTQPAWHMADLLFISMLGDDHNRGIAFAHFSHSTSGLPELRTFSWDCHETHFFYLANFNLHALRWPADDTNPDAWRAQWRSAFTTPHRYVVSRAQELAAEMARHALAIREVITEVFALEKPNGPLHALYKLFTSALLHDLTPEAFADTVAQTVTYGLFSAATQTNKLTLDHLVDLIPPTNPFLKSLLAELLSHAGVDLQELGIEQLLELFRATDIDAILRDFGRQSNAGREDPVVHFYEDFLQLYDPAQREQRGVFYTPKPVVSFIVRSLHELLQKEFGIEDGLASTITWAEVAANLAAARRLDDDNTSSTPDSCAACRLPPHADPHSFFVTILDPATGTGTFIETAIEVIYDHLRAKWQHAGPAAMPKLPGCHRAFSSFDSYWSAYVPHALLPRLYGFELMMASYTVAHLKIGLTLKQTGYDFKSGERLRIYLTNTLEPPVQLDELAGIALHFLSQESREAAIVKSSVPITVIIGNPPYSGHSANKNKWSEELVKNGYTRADGSRDEGYYMIDGKPLGEKNPKWLQDDYVKFIRFAQWMTDRTGIGLVGMITNHSYLDNPTFRGMRRSLLNSYERLLFLDLHGNAKKKEKAPDGSKDENVFNIQQGVAIALMLNKGQQKCAVHRADLYGTREHKFAILAQSSVSSTTWQPVQPEPEFYLFVRQDTDTLLRYNAFPKITDIMPVNVLGFQTHRDDFAIAFDREEIYRRISDMRSTKLSDDDLRRKYGLKDNRDWQLSAARAMLRKMVDWEKHIIQCLYRPFDWRWCYFSEVAMDYPRRELLDHVAGKENLCLGVGRQGMAVNDPMWSLLCVSTQPIDANVFRRGGVNVFPLKLTLKSNITTDYVVAVRSLMSKRESATPETQKLLFDTERVLFGYSFAILQSTFYRQKYDEFLKTDFPRIPFTCDAELFAALAKLGGELVELHLLQSPLLKKPISHYQGPARPVVEHVSYADGTVWLNKARTAGFHGVSENVWQYYIGGYQVCAKWLKDRKGRALSDDDLTHYNKIVTALHHTIRLQAEIDQLYPRVEETLISFPTDTAH